MNKRFLFWGLLVVIVILLIIFAPKEPTNTTSRPVHPGNRTHHTSPTSTHETSILNLVPRGPVDWHANRDDIFTYPTPPKPVETKPQPDHATTEQTGTAVGMHHAHTLDFFGLVTSPEGEQKALLSFHDDVITLSINQCAHHYCLKELNKRRITLYNQQTHHKMTISLGDSL